MAQANSDTVETLPIRLLTREEAEHEDRVFWHSKTPAERLAAAEQLRQIAYGYELLPPEFKRLLSWVQLTISQFLRSQDSPT